MGDSKLMHSHSCNMNNMKKRLSLRFPKNPSAYLAESSRNVHKVNSRTLGTAHDHRITNYNRIRVMSKLAFAVVVFSHLISFVDCTASPEPVRVSSKNSQYATSTTTRSTSFRPSNAINFLSLPSPVKKPLNSSLVAHSFSFSMPRNMSESNASRRSASASRKRKDHFQKSTPSSIDRPFYTKITSQDAVPKPSTKGTSSREKYAFSKSQRRPSSLSPSSQKKGKGRRSKKGKYSKKGSMKGSREELSSFEDMMDTDLMLMPQTTEKSYHRPKLSLEPFFNFLTSLASASKEVILSKEQGTTEPPESQNLPTKYSPSYETINQSIREGAKKSKKGAKGKNSSGSGETFKKKKKNRSKENKHRFRGSIEELSSDSEDEEIELVNSHEFKEQRAEINAPPPPTGPLEDEEDGKDATEGNDAERGQGSSAPAPNDDPLQEEEEETALEKPAGLHILDVLRTPMIPDYEVPQRQPPPPPPPQEVIRIKQEFAPSKPDFIINSSPNFKPVGSVVTVPKNGFQVHGSNYSVSSSVSMSSSISSSNSNPPPSGRASRTKVQGHVVSIEKETVEKGNATKSQQFPRENGSEERRQEQDPLMPSSSVVNMVYDRPKYPITSSSDPDLQAQESVTRAQVFVPNHYPIDGMAPSASSYQYQYHFHQQPPKVNEQNIGVAPEVESGSELQKHDDLVSKYPTTFVFQPPRPGPILPSSPPPFPGPSSRPFLASPSPPPPPPRGMYGPPPTSRVPFRLKKLRPNLHSYYDASYHKFAGTGEAPQLVASEIIGIRHPYGPPHFRPPPPGPTPMGYRGGPPPPPPPPRFRPGFMMPAGPPPSHRIVSDPANDFRKPYEGKIMNSPMNSDYDADLTGNDNNNNINSNDISLSGSANAGDASDQFTAPSHSEENANLELSETKKVGIMDQFELFYKEFKLLTWVAVFFVTSLCFLTLLVYLYVNNPPTEVVQAREFPYLDIIKNPQIIKFLSNIVDSTRMQRTADADRDDFIKPYGNGFGGKSGRQKRKHTRSQGDKVKYARRASKRPSLANSALISTTKAPTPVSSTPPNSFSVE